MRHLIAWALACALACFAAPAIAQHAADSAAPAGFAPEQACFAWSGGKAGAGALLACDAPRTFAPTGGAAESSTAAAFTFSAATQAAMRGWYANCPIGTTATVTLVGVNGGTAPRTLYDGWQDNDDRLAGFSGNTAGCTIGARF